jgi:hypothetical protein
MAAKKNTAAMDLIVAALKSNPSASYKEIAAEAAKAKLQVFPIMYGRAQKLLGLAKGAGKAKKAKPAKAAKAKAKAKAAAKPVVVAAMADGAPVKRGRGRPRKHPLPVAANAASLDGIIAAVKSADQARARYMAAIQKIQAVLADALR